MQRPANRAESYGFLRFASAEAATRAVAMMNGAEFNGKTLELNWAKRMPCRNWLSPGGCKAGDSCQFSHDGPAGRGRGGFAGTVLARHCADARSTALGDGHREPRWSAPPHAFPPRRFGPTRLSEAVRRRLDAPALNALAELETFDADAVVQGLEEAGLTVRNPTAYVCKAVERVRNGGMPGIGIRSRCFKCGKPGHLARDCPSAARGARGAPPDSLASLPPPSARSNNQVLGDWICGNCGGNNFARRRECRRCGTPKSGEQTNYGYHVPHPTPPRHRSRSRSRSRERRRRRSGYRS